MCDTRDEHDRRGVFSPTFCRSHGYVSLRYVYMVHVKQVMDMTYTYVYILNVDIYIYTHINVHHYTSTFSHPSKWNMLIPSEDPISNGENIWQIILSKGEKTRCKNARVIEDGWFINKGGLTFMLMSPVIGLCNLILYTLFYVRLW